MQDHVIRMSVEISELADKISKLRDFINGDVFATLSQEERCLMYDQHHYMKHYHDTLSKRFYIASK